MIVAIASDHAGLVLWQVVADAVESAGHQPLRLGPHDGKPVDYPSVVRLVGDAIASGRATRGILLCGSGAGVTVAANKLPGIRAAYGTDDYTGQQMVEHDDCNVLTLGGRVMGPAIAADVTRAFVNAKFSRVERHARRLGEVIDMERERCMNAATQLHQAGQSLWLDNITRSLLTSGQLARYIADASVTGLTSNPSIFDKAITGSNDYDDQARQLTAKGLDEEALFFELALDDLTKAAALFEPVWDATDGVDGWVSLEVSPRLAHDSKKTVAEAKALHLKAATPNLFIKVPGTREGLPAIEELTFEGVPVNVTLLFSDQQYLDAAGAYLNGLERRKSAGRKLDVPSVASLFVSRWDHATMDQLPAELKDVLGIAVAKQTYRSYRQMLASKRWTKLSAEGAHPQRLLFASTGTKNPAKPDTYYIEALAAPQTINTIPPATLEAFVDHGKVGQFLPADGGDADQVIAHVEAAGIDVPALAAKLQSDGATAFVSAWEDLMGSIKSKAAVLSGAAR